MSASTMPVTSALAVTPAPLKRRPKLTGSDTAVARYGPEAWTVRSDADLIAQFETLLDKLF